MLFFGVFQFGMGDCSQNYIRISEDPFSHEKKWMSVTCYHKNDHVSDPCSVDNHKLVNAVNGPNSDCQNSSLVGLDLAILTESLFWQSLFRTRVLIMCL